MKEFSLIVFLTFLFFASSAQVIPYQELPRPASKPGTDIYLRFESPGDEIIIEDGYLTHQSKNYHHEEGYATAVSSQSVAESVPLDGRQLTILKERIASSNFYQARVTSGSRMGGEHSLHIRTDQGENRLVFAGNPDYAGAPPAYRRIVDYLWQLIIEVEQ
mgnify:CR=1 FL=1